jgi:hypothetical protein
MKEAKLNHEAEIQDGESLENILDNLTLRILRRHASHHSPQP